ncbi:hypothetical protein HK098_003494 [Nowakowskiella sp. JEL0407]|nr:hypothetical protein HK098_003494 [Nowakowskiella sp. JEL0407]
MEEVTIQISIPYSDVEFDIHKPIAQGGMAKRDSKIRFALLPRSGIDVAVKAIHGQMIPNSGTQLQLVQEVKLLASLWHNNIIVFYGVSIDTDIPLLVLEFADGGSLYSVCTMGLLFLQLLQRLMIVSKNAVFTLTLIPGRPTHLFSGSNDYTIREWDTITGQTIRTYSGYTGGVKALASIFKDTEYRLFSASMDSSILEWNITIRNHIGHTSEVLSLTFLDANDEKPHMFSGSTDGTIREWSTIAGQTVQLYPKSEYPVDSLIAIQNPPGILFGFGIDIKEIDATTGEITRTYSGHLEEVTSLAVLTGNTLCLF